MKRLVLTSMALVPFAFGPALAADMLVKAPPPAPIAFSWTGCYIGGVLGASWDGGGSSVTDSVLQTAVGPFPVGSAFGATPSPSSIPYNANVTGGGTIGCNYQFGVFVLGVEGEGGYLHSHANFAMAGPAGLTGTGVGSTSLIVDSTIGNWYALATGRFGLVNDHVMYYVKGGAAFTKVDTTITNGGATAGNPVALSETGSRNLTGWAAGAGIEWAFMPNWTVKAEGLYMGFNKSYNVCGSGVTFTGLTIPSSCAIATVGGIATFKLGLNYLFSYGLAGPVTARY
jgi:outer membrane immunogenic protein